jgi:maleate isomerase
VDVTVGAISVGILTPHLAAGPEVELPAIAPGLVATQVARISVPGVVASSGGTPQPTGLRELATPDALEEAATAFAPGSIDAIAYASTSSAYTLGFDTESAMVAELSSRLGLPVASTGRSAVQAVRMLNVERLALVHPPWFDDEVNELGASYFASQDVTVIVSASADLANDPSRIETEAVVDWVTRNVPDNAEAIFFGGNGFLAAGAIDRLETTDRAVLESNQVLLWSILEAIGEPLDIQGYGQLLALPSPGCSWP